MSNRALRGRAYRATFAVDTEFEAEIIAIARVILSRPPYCVRTVEDLAEILKVLP